jgi:hypothetical protein
MIYPTTPDASATPGVRDGQSAPVTCAACGCRLEASTLGPITTWHHFGPMAGRDARGCRIDCADAPHDAAGVALVSTPA